MRDDVGPRRGAGRLRRLGGQPSDGRPPGGRLRWAGGLRRIGWGALALFLAAFAIFESVKYGLPTTVAMLLFFALIDLARLAGVRPPGALHQALHRVWIPLVVVVAYSFGPIVWPPLFTAGLGWLTRIAVERAFGRGMPLTAGT